MRPVPAPARRPQLPAGAGCAEYEQERWGISGTWRPGGARQRQERARVGHGLGQRGQLGGAQRHGVADRAQRRQALAERRRGRVLALVGVQPVLVGRQRRQEAGALLLGGHLRARTERRQQDRVGYRNPTL